MKKLRKLLVKYIIKNKFYALTEDDILILSGRDWLLKKRKLSKEDVILLKEEAQYIQNSLAWKLATRDVRFQAYKHMGDNATKPEDLDFGKAMGYNLSLLEKFFENLTKLL